MNINANFQEYQNFKDEFSSTFTGFLGLLSDSPEGAGQKGGAGRRLGLEDAPRARGPRSWTPRPRDPRRGRRKGEGRPRAETAGVCGGAGPTISSSPGAEAEREVPRAPPPSALPPRRLSAAGSRHDAETASERNRLRRARRRRGRRSPPPPERRHRLGSLPFPARGGGGGGGVGGAHARPFRRRASAGRAGEAARGRRRAPLLQPARPSAIAPRAGLLETGAAVTAPVRGDPGPRPASEGWPHVPCAPGGPARAAASPRAAWEPSDWATSSPPAV